VEACRLKLDVEIPATRVDSVLNQAVAHVHSVARIPGFRPGKSPKSLLKRKYSKEIQAEALRQLVREGMQQALKQEGLTPETNPKLENEDTLEAKAGESLVLSMTFDVAPTFELPEYKGLKVVRQDVQVDDEAVNKVIDDWLQQRATYEKVERAAVAGDLLKVSYSGKLLGDEEVELAESAKFLLEAEDTWLALREPEILPGCTEALAGVEAGDEKTLTVEFPESFFDKSLVGKKAEYQIKIAEVHGSKVPELNDEMAKEVGAEDAEAVRKNVREHLEADHASRQQQMIREQVLQAVMGELDFALPPSILARETYEQLMHLLNSQKNGAAQPEAPSQEEMLEKAKVAAKARLLRHYVLAKIADAEKVEVSSEEIDAAIESMSHQHKMKPKALRQRITENGRIVELYASIRESKMVERLVELADIQDVPAEG
jgi:trigger factor